MALLRAGSAPTRPNISGWLAGTPPASATWRLPPREPDPQPDRHPSMSDVRADTSVDTAAAGSASTAAHVWDPATRPLLIGLVLTITLVAFESLSVITVLPVVAKDLGGLHLYGWVT